MVPSRYAMVAGLVGTNDRAFSLSTNGVTMAMMQATNITSAAAPITLSSGFNGIPGAGG